jgi:hypothetical protein
VTTGQDLDAALELLREGTISVEGRLPYPVDGSRGR